MASKKHIFTQFEKKVFLDILKNYSTIVENKNTDGSSLREKTVAWDKITRDYNASPHVTTEISNKQLRRLWMNLKQRQRGAMTKERQHRMATGGGPSTSDAVIDPDIAQIAPALMIEVPGAIDSDSVFPASSMTLDSSQSELSLTISQEPDMELPPPHSTTTPHSPTMITVPPPTITTPPPPTITTPPPPLNTIPIPHSSGTTPPYPSTASTPPLSIRTIQPPPTQSSFSTTTTSFQRHKNTILEKEYRDRLNRAGELHEMEKELVGYKIREAKAKAELAELILERERQQDT